LTVQSSAADAGKRLDLFILERFPDHSRSRLQQWIKEGHVHVNGAAGRASYRMKGGETVDIEPAPLTPLRATPEDLPVEVLYEDADVVAINKPAGMVVHAGAGVRSGTVVNALLYRFGLLSSAGGEERPGIVHRLDRYTSGVLLVARNDAAHRNLAAQFAERRVEKVYLALVEGAIPRDRGRIEKPISRDPVRRIRMTARRAEGRAAITEYQVLRRFAAFTLLEVRIKTGRTHQIRAHFSAIGHPVAGDRLYGAAGGERFFLHAHRLRFYQPSTGEPVQVVSPLPVDLEGWLSTLV
jgi:23S rRNA pseudouridine1911/1915/1917 synthase